MNRKKEFKAKIKFFHLLPSNDFGGAESAARTCMSLNDNKFTFSTYFINIKSVSKNFFIRIINEIINYLNGFRFFIKQKRFVLISSLWKSSILSLLIKLFLPKTKIILFLHSSKNTHIFDKLFTSILLLFANEVWADSKSTLMIRFENLFFKRKFIKTKIVSFVIRKLKPVINAEKVSFNFIYWGRLHKVKNLVKTIKFFYKFYCLDKTSKLTLIGEDYGMKNELESVIKKLGIGNNVNIFKFMNMDKISELVNGYSFFIQLSIYEGMAISVVESMQLGLIPIVTNVGEIQRYCIDKKNSIIFEEFNKTFEKVIEVKNNYKLYKEISKKASETWKNKKLYKEDIYSSCNSFYLENKF